MTNVARRSPSGLPRVRSAVHDRLIAMLSAFALLAGLGVDVHATVMLHGTAHAAASIDAPHDDAPAEPRGGHHAGAPGGHPDAPHAAHQSGPHRDDPPAEHSASACCHAVCPATVVPSDTGSCTALRLAADSSLRLLESTRTDGLQHAPPLRPPR